MNSDNWLFPKERKTREDLEKRGLKGISGFFKRRRESEKINPESIRKLIENEKTQHQENLYKSQRDVSFLKDVPKMTKSHSVSLPIDIEQLKKLHSTSNEFGIINAVNSEGKFQRINCNKSHSIDLALKTLPLLKKNQYVETLEKFSIGNPSGRQDAENSKKWFEIMKSKYLEKEGVDEENSLVIFGICGRELVRQVSVHCIERGKLLKDLLENIENFHKVNNKRLESKMESEKSLIKQKLDSLVQYYKAAFLKIQEKNKKLKEKKENIAKKLEEEVEISMEVKIDMEEMKETHEREIQCMKKGKLLFGGSLTPSSIKSSDPIFKLQMSLNPVDKQINEFYTKFSKTALKFEEEKERSKLKEEADFLSDMETQTDTETNSQSTQTESRRKSSTQFQVYNSQNLKKTELISEQVIEEISEESNSESEEDSEDNINPYKQKPQTILNRRKSIQEVIHESYLRKSLISGGSEINDEQTEFIKNYLSTLRNKINQEDFEERFIKKALESGEENSNLESARNSVGNEGDKYRDLSEKESEKTGEEKEERFSTGMEEAERPFTLSYEKSKINFENLSEENPPIEQTNSDTFEFRNINPKFTLAFQRQFQNHTRIIETTENPIKKKHTTKSRLITTFIKKPTNKIIKKSTISVKMVYKMISWVYNFFYLKHKQFEEDFVEIIYDEFTNKYGLKTVAEKKFLDFLATLHKFPSKRCEIMKNLLTEKNYKFSAFIAASIWRNMIHSNTGIVVGLEESSKEILLPKTRAVESLKEVMENVLERSDYYRMIFELEDLTVSDPKKINSAGLVDLDSVLDLAVKYHEEYVENILKGVEMIFEVTGFEILKQEILLMVFEVNPGKFSLLVEAFEHELDVTDTLSAEEVTQIAVELNLLGYYDQIAYFPNRKFTEEEILSEISSIRMEILEFIDKITGNVLLDGGVIEERIENIENKIDSIDLAIAGRCLNIYKTELLRISNV